MTLYQYITESRRKRFRSAKAFWSASKPDFSYEYYSNIERGTKVPNIKVVLELCKTLGLNKKKACFLWAMEAMPDKQTKNFFRWDDEGVEKNVPLGRTIELENTFLVTEKHRKLLEKDPIYWEILSFFAVHESMQFTLKQIVDSIDIPKKTLTKVLDELLENNLLLFNRGRYSHPKIYMHIPNDRHFFKLRNQNFYHTSKQLIYGMKAKDVEDERAFRTTINKKLTPLQIDSVMQHIRFIIGNLLNLTTPVREPDGTPYTFCVAFAERNFKKRKPSEAKK